MGRIKYNLDDELVISQYYALRSTTEVAKIYGCADETIRRLLIKNGVSLTKWKTPQRQCSHTYTKVNEAERKAIIDEYQKRRSIKVVAKIFNRSPDTISRAVHSFIPSNHVSICGYCGKVFVTDRDTKKFCSRNCRNMANSSDDRKRCRRYGVFYDPDVKREQVFERDGYICQICGIKCDVNDLGWGSNGATHPTIDHIIPLSKGGAHIWSNVQCACGLCNSRKQDKIMPSGL